ncbi:MAG TPA: helix-turn-helix domain-containing protein [Nitrosospira sp.]|jgi:Fis family transcriptional regulator
MSIINENEIARCVRNAVEEYFNDLDGEKPHAIHEMVMCSVEKPLIEMLMKQAGGNQTRAAELLGINRNTLRNKIKQYQIK